MKIVQEVNTIIKWDDECNLPRYFINGQYIGAAEDFMELIDTFVDFNLKGKLMHTAIGANSDCSLEELDDLSFGTIANWFDTVYEIPEAAELAIFDRDWNKLLKILANQI